MSNPANQNSFHISNSQQKEKTVELRPRFLCLDLCWAESRSVTKHCLFLLKPMPDWRENLCWCYDWTRTPTRWNWFAFVCTCHALLAWKIPLFRRNLVTRFEVSFNGIRECFAKSESLPGQQHISSSVSVDPHNAAQGRETHGIRQDLKKKEKCCRNALGNRVCWNLVTASLLEVLRHKKNSTFFFVSSDLRHCLSGIKEGQKNCHCFSRYKNRRGSSWVTIKLCQISNWS